MNEKEKNAVLVVLFVGILAIVGVVYYHMMFARATISDLKTKIATEEKNITKQTLELKKLQGWMSREGEMESLRATISKVTRRLPSSTDAPGFLAALLEVLRGTGIIQERVKSELPQARSQYTEIPYSVKAYGRYHELGQFLTLIEQNPDRFMRVKSLSLKNNNARPSIHPIDMEIKTFTFAGSGADLLAKSAATTPGAPAR